MSSTLDLTQAARLFYGDVEVAELHRDGQRLWPFGPDLLDWDGVTGASYYADPDTLFSDEGVTLAGLGEPIRQINDRAGTGINGGQSTLAYRPVRGRAPSQRRNFLTYSEDFSNDIWAKGNMAVIADPEISPSGAPAWKLIPNTTSGTHLIRQQFSIGTGWVFVVEMKAAEFYKVVLFENINTSSGTRIIDLRDGTTLDATAQNGTTTVVPLGNGWFRIIWQPVLNSFPNNGCAIYVLPNDAGAYYYPYYGTWAGDGTSGLLVAAAQLEPAPFTSYQRVGAVWDVTEAGLPDRPVLVFPNGYGSMQSAFSAGFSGQVLVAGMNGSWLDTVPALTAGQSFGMGMDYYIYGSFLSWRGTVRQGLIATGPVVGWTMRSGGFQPGEIDRLLRDYGRRGAKGLLAATGPDLAPNGDFVSDTGWNKFGPSVIWSGGQYTIADAAGVDSGISAQLVGALPGRAYQVEVVITANTQTPAGFRAGIGIVSGDRWFGDYFAPPTPFTGIWRFTFQSLRADPWITFLASETDQFVTIDSVSVRELVAQPLP